MKSTFLFLITLLFLGSSTMWASFDILLISEQHEQTKLHNSKEQSINNNDYTLSSYQLGPDKRPMRLDERVANGGEKLSPCSGPSPGDYYCSCYSFKSCDNGEVMGTFCVSRKGSGGFCDKQSDCN